MRLNAAGDDGVYFLKSVSHFCGGGAYGSSYQEPFCGAGYAVEWGTSVGGVKGIG